MATNASRSKNSPEVDRYIQSFPQEVQELLALIRQTIRETAPAAEEGISYGIPTFKLGGNLVHYAAYAKHLGFYPGASGISRFLDRFEGYHVSKGTVQFPLDQPLPLDLIREIVLFRVQENQRKAGKAPPSS